MKVKLLDTYRDCQVLQTRPLIAFTFFVRVAIADFLDLLRDRLSMASSARFSGCGVRFFFCSSAATTWTAPRLFMVGASSCARWGATATRLPLNTPACGRLVLNAACIFLLLLLLLVVLGCARRNAAGWPG